MKKIYNIKKYDVISISDITVEYTNHIYEK